MVVEQRKKKMHLEKADRVPSANLIETLVVQKRKQNRKTSGKPTLCLFLCNNFVAQWSFRVLCNRYY